MRSEGLALRGFRFSIKGLKVRGLGLGFQSWGFAVLDMELRVRRVLITFFAHEDLACGVQNSGMKVHLNPKPWAL